jgi:tyrosyl-tRNA synthetase
MKKMTLTQELTWRGFVNQTTYKDLSILDGKPITFYWGVDPTADSMHIGHFSMAMMVRHFIEHGHKPILLIGGATALIGDPDGKDEERQFISVETVEDNKKNILNQYKKIFDGYEAMMVDNYTWFKNVGYLNFLRDIGKHVPMSQMLGREFIQTRLGNEGSGISYAEFSYSLIQGYDFLHLYREYGVNLQVCGSDQWGNSIAGVELIRRIENAEANIWSAPLIINKVTGKKFGKTEAGAIWLDENKTSVYQFYQYWLNVDDEGVEDYLKIYTLLSKEEIDNLMESFNQNRSGRVAQKTLAYEVTKLVHGKDRADGVKRISEVLFGGLDYNELKSPDFKELAKEIGLVSSNMDKSVIDLIVEAKLANSKSDARRFAQSGAIYINGKPMDASKVNLENIDFIDGYLILRRGKNAQTVIKNS